MAGVSSKANIAKGQAFSSSLRNSLLINLVSEWKFNGNTVDSWGINDGVWSGSTEPNIVANYRPASECVSGQCLDFDGVDDNVMVPTINLPDGTKWTCEHWLNWREQSNLYVFYIGAYAASPNFLIRRNSLNNFSFRPTGGAGIYYDFVSSAEYINRWTHVVWAADGNANITLYINGRLILTRTIIAPHTTEFNLHAIGRSYGGTSYTFLGKIDDVRAYTDSIPLSQIQENYYSGLNKLLSNNGIDNREFGQRITELKFDLAANE